MKTPAQLRSDIWNLVDSAVSIASNRIIHADPNNPRPNLPYITIRISSAVIVGQPFTPIKADGTGVGKIKYDEDFTVALNSFGRNSDTYLQEIKHYLNTSAGRDKLTSLCLSIRNENGPITDISLLIDETIEKRYLYEIFLGYAQTYDDDVGFIEDVEITDTINQPS